MKIKLVLYLAISALLLNSAAFAQTHRGSIRGTIGDSAQTILADVPVRLIHEETGEARTAASDAAGEFIISLLPPGSYRLEVESAGFKKHIQKLTLRVNQDLRADVRLEVGQIAEEVIVTAPTAPLRKDSIALGAVIENRQVTGLPLDGRNFLELSLLVPGAVPAAPGSAGSVRGDFAFNINGAREDSNNFLLDGVYNIDPKLNTFGVKPPVDAVREFEVLASTYDASFGRNAGAQVNVVLKSGTNGFHGTAYEFFRNSALDARNYFAPSDQGDPEYKRNQFGFSLGGPIVRNRTFFFADYEGTRSREGITRITTVPTLLERRGDFSQSLFPPPINPFTQQPFPGNVIPDFAINPIGLSIAALFPEPNRNVPFGNFVSSPAQRDRNDSFDARVDHILSSASTLAFRYSFADRDLFEPFSGPTFSAVPGFGTDIPRRAQNLMMGETHVFSSAFVNEARFAFNRVASGAFQEGRGESINRQVGLPEFSNNPRDFGLSFITVGGFTPLGDEFNNPQHSVTNIFQVLDNASYAKGRHLFKFGFDFRALQQNAFRDVQSRGFLNFQGVFTGNPLADLLIGFPTVTGAARLDNHQHLRAESYNFYLNDTYRITPRLTLSAGLRYEYNSPPVDPEDRATVFDPETRTLIRVGTGDVPRGGFEADRNNFAPRVGFAWTVTESGNTVLRGGYGVYYDQSALAPGEGLYFSPPFFDFNLFTSLPNQFLTLNDPFPSSLPNLFPDSTLAFQRDLRTAYMQHWNFNIQQQLGKSRVLEVGYVGSKGTKLLAARDFNQPAPAPVQFVIRPIPQFDDINIIESRANSNYHSLQMRLQQRLDFGLSFLSSYTWSKSIDDASNFFTSAGDPNFPQDSNNLRAERGRSNFDIRHRFSLSYSYDIPIGKGHAFLGDNGWVSSLLAGWQTYGIVTLQTGRPFTVALLPDIDRSGTGRSSLGFGANDRPNVAGNPELSDPTPDRWFDTSAFALQPAGTFGNAGRNILEGPDFKNFNVSLVKNASLTERMNLQFRAEAFNVFNRPNFNLPDNFLLSPTFGRVLSAQSPRHIQLGVKLMF